jgi:hypothetical protein
MLQNYFDRFAIMLSGICAIHCILLPIAVSAMPIFVASIDHDDHLHDFVFHQAILLFILPVSIIALYTGFRSHQQLTPIAIASIGLLFLVSVALFAERMIESGIMQHEGETILTVIGGVTHALGHILNVLATRRFHKHNPLN